jgi:hypothetical protein
MGKTVFKNRLFYILLIGFIIIFLIYNSYVFIKSSDIYVLIPILIEIALLILILTKNQYAKLSILIWAVIALIIGFGFELIASLIDDFNTDFQATEIDSLIYNTLGLIAGILIIDYTKRTVSVASSSVDTDL